MSTTLYHDAEATYFDADGSCYPDPFGPSTADEAWASAASRRGVWAWSRTERLEALITRAVAIEEALRRRRCETVGRDGEILHGRYSDAVTRRQALQAAARVARRAERLAPRPEPSRLSVDALQRMAAMMTGMGTFGHEA